MHFKFFFSSLFILTLSNISAQNLTIEDSVVVLDQLDTISELILQKRTDSLLKQKQEYFDDEENRLFIKLKKEDLPPLTDADIKANLAKIPTTLNIRFTPEIGNKIRAYLYKHRTMLVKVLTRSEYYFPIFEEILDRNQMPLELKYLSVIESHLNPNAQSPMGASGLWQFMYTTAKYKGMQISTLEDQRNDPYIATEYATQYLNQLYLIYDDWLLAMSAYNAGAGNINKAIRSCGGIKNYWVARPYMPKETQEYVPKIIAIMYAMYYSDLYSLYPAAPEFNFYETFKAPVYDKLSFKFLSELTGVSIDELEILNPSLTKQLTPKRDTGYVLILPNYALLNFEKNKGFLYDDPYLAVVEQEMEERQIQEYKKPSNGNYILYEVKTGDNLGYIAQIFDCRIADIKRWNGLSSNFLSIGKKLKIFGAEENPVASISASSTNTSNTNNSKVAFTRDESKTIVCTCSFHEIVSGDNLWDIAVAYNTSVEAIKRANNIPAKWILKLGLFLKIPK